MPLTAAITSDNRGSGAGWVTTTFTETVSGEQHTRIAHLVAGVDALALANSLIPREETNRRKRELDLAFDMMLKGDDPHTIEYVWITAEEINQFCVRSAANLMRESEIELFDLIACEKQFEAWGWNNAKVLSYLEGANTGQVNGWRNWISGQATALSTFINGIPEQTP